MKKSYLRAFTIFSLVVALSGACSLFSGTTPTPVSPPTATATVTATATFTATPTATGTPVPLSQQVKISSVHAEESGQSPNYTITSETPVILNSDDPRAQQFNSLASDLVAQDINEFKASLKYVPGTPVSSGSFLHTKWELISPPGPILSIKYDIDGYADGAAHPYHYSQTLNFDIEQGRQIPMDSLFQPGSDYLQQIADYCKAELATRDIAFDPSSGGADPTSQNYRNWNITGAGLLITFDEYQVAPYAAGPQTVVIPYSSLSAVIDPAGPLASFIR